MKKLRLIYSLVTHLGPSWCMFRLGYAFKLKSGWFRRVCPANHWENIDFGRALRDPKLAEPKNYQTYCSLAKEPKFFFSTADQEKFRPFFREWDADGSPLAEANSILAGKFRFYSKMEMEVGFPPNWHRNHFTGETTPTDQHWSELNDFGYGDIKNIWELSRFGWAYTLVRAYWRTGDERYPEAFWKLFEDWMANNSPNLGVHWKCGQEISFRIMAWCFAFYGFIDSSTSLPERKALLAKAVMVSIDRVEANLSYAVSQKNNHGISEGMGLFTVGILFPEFKKAGGFLAKGRAVLESSAQDLIYEDGAFSQYSLNYHRVMLHDYLWVIRLAELNEYHLSTGLRERVLRAVRFLFESQDSVSGQVPLYGSNDGALILPLTNCDYLDFRPAVALGEILEPSINLTGQGPWEEALLWLRGVPLKEEKRSSAARVGSVVTKSGYLALRGRESFLFSRTGRSRHRPSEADLLHADIWWRGVNLAGDAGTYSYNAPAPWGGALKKTYAHNTLSIDGKDQMSKVGRFLWLPWANGGWKINKNSFGDCFEGWHDGYERLEPGLRHRRAFLSGGDDWWIIIDRATSKIKRSYRLQWLLGDFPVSLGDAEGGYLLSTMAGNFYLAMAALVERSKPEFSLIKGDSQTPRGWRSLYYQNLLPVSSITCSQLAQEITFVSVFSPSPVRLRLSPTSIDISSPARRVSITIGSGVAEPLVADWNVFTGVK